MEAEDGKPSSMELFPFKLFRMLNEATTEGFDSIVSWIPTSSSTSSLKPQDRYVDGESNGGDDGRIDIATSNNIIHLFRVHKPKEFEEFIMPIYFRRTNKYRTFTRSLNLWCFDRIGKGPLKNAYFHPLFKKDEPSSCNRLVRVKNKNISKNPKQANYNDHSEDEDVFSVRAHEATSSSSLFMQNVNYSNHSASLDIVSGEKDVFSVKAPANTSTISSLLLMQTQGPDNTAGGSTDRCLSGDDLMGSFDWEPDLMGSFDWEPVPIMTKTDEPSEPSPPFPSITSTGGIDQVAGKGIDMLLLEDDAFTPRPIHPASLAALAGTAAATNVGMNQTTVGSGRTNLLAEATIPQNERKVGPGKSLCRGFRKWNPHRYL